ncbi:hypothetical protein M513_03758 [Trichuris suis]|uniref:Uncharacterized protein n=1 Tax=Trichuris suis TaxID=68888 RepID=A0A085MDX2_9BILA|nr:hypothetical protein M513_03758 [Trichuris suis]
MEKAVRQRIREGHATWSVLTVRGACFDSRLTTDTVDGLHMEAFAFLQFDLLQIKDFKAAYTTAMVADLASRDTEPLTAVRQLFNSLLSSVGSQPSNPDMEPGALFHRALKGPKLGYASLPRASQSANILDANATSQ